MGRSPLRTLFTFALLFAIVGFIISNIQSGVDWYGINNFPPVQELRLARFYWSTGQTDRATTEYKSIIQDKIPGINTQANEELNRLISFEDDSIGKFIGYVSYAVWILPPNLYVIASLFAVLWLIVFIAGRLTQRPLFVIMPIQDLSKIDLGEKLPQLATDRLREVVWGMQTLDAATSLLSESLELPIMGMINEGDTIDSVALIETALMFSGGPNDLPLSRLINSLRLWLEQPKFLVRGNLRKWGNTLCLQVILLGRANAVEQAWKIEVDDDESTDAISELVDGLIYPLLLRFSRHTRAKRWEALKSLHDGLHEFQLYREQGYLPIHLHRAKEFMEKTLSIDPNYTPAKNNLGLLLLRSGNYEGAKELFWEMSISSENKKDRLFALYNYGVALFHLSQDWAYKRASEAFQNILDDSHGEEMRFINLVSSTLAVTYARLAMRDSRDNEKYIELALQLTKKVLESHEITKEIEANALSAKGFIFLARKEYESAIVCFTDAVQEFPESMSCLIGLGEVYLQSHQIDRAIDTFRKAQVISPSSGYPSFKLGNIYREKGDLEQAREAYLHAPDFALAHVALGKMHLMEQEYGKALDEFRIATQQNKRLSEAWVNIAWTICEMKTDDSDLLNEAESSARRALQLEQNPAQFWHRHAVLARILLLKGKSEVSLQEALIAVQAGTDRAQAHYYLAEAECSLDQYARARASLEKVMKLKGEEWHVAAEKLLQQIEEMK